MKLLVLLFISLTCPAFVSAQFGGIFDQILRNAQHQGGGGQGRPSDFSGHETGFFNAPCNDYLCPDTLTCVKKPVECPCQFPSSEIKCILPDKKNYVCISKPSDGSSDIYDDPSKASNTNGDGTIKDCAFVNLAWKGLV
ncbi:hypothetical protein NADFUDRAFT_52990 [Nadsonia fulvescens var. elongata DSM 6958]|uniref:Long chronological lifespan protein 2 n=1 Tax=Nadsonia fulvescens var. elongata DSM 6958 TaxID=857566 RepID=A0A1E3PF29_9ASCO|nr:hypothetical protein NADFUDRAFT_52990 [Nadsonia fulvescens var. elongata DSM 6958]